jgi:hypothetical protein
VPIRGKIIAAIAAFALGSSSCATLINGPGREQLVSIYTDPPGASVEVGGQQTVSPVLVSLDRNVSTRVVAWKPGYETATATLHSSYSWATYLDLILIAPWVIDLVSGALYSLSPDIVNLQLTPVGVAQDIRPK